MKTKTKSKTTPKFRHWDSHLIICSGSDLAMDTEVDDDAVRLTYGFTMSPTIANHSKEYLMLSSAIREEDGEFLNGYLSNTAFNDIMIEGNLNYTSQTSLTRDIQTYYAGEKWGLVNTFDVAVIEKERQCFMDILDVKNIYLSEHPGFLLDALAFFNNLSFENTTHFIRLHEMWNRLRDIQQVGFKLDTPLPKDYTKLLVPHGSIKPRQLNGRSLSKLIKTINKYHADYKIKRQDYFGKNIYYEDRSKSYANWYKNSFEGFLGKILNAFIFDLEITKILKVCDYCGNVYKYTEKKKYCSIQDGTDCGKSARNKRFYRKYRTSLMPKAKKSSKELRDFYKEKGIKK